MSIINEPPAPLPPVKVNFYWPQLGPQTVVTYAGDSYPYPPLAGEKPSGLERYIMKTTVLNEQLTFDATNVTGESIKKKEVKEREELVIAPEGVVILQYIWNFGDGTTGFGPTATHTYKVLDPEIEVSLTVVDSRNLRWSAARAVILASLPFGTMTFFKLRAPTTAATKPKGLFERTAADKAETSDTVSLLLKHTGAGNLNVRVPAADSVTSFEVTTVKVSYKVKVEDRAESTESTSRIFTRKLSATDNAVSSDTAAKGKQKFVWRLEPKLTFKGSVTPVKEFLKTFEAKLTPGFKGMTGQITRGLKALLEPFGKSPH